MDLLRDAYFRLIEQMESISVYALGAVVAAVMCLLLLWAVMRR